MITSEGVKACPDTCQAPNFRLHADRSLRSQPVNLIVGRLSRDGSPTNMSAMNTGILFLASQEKWTEGTYCLIFSMLVERLKCPSSVIDENWSVDVSPFSGCFLCVFWTVFRVGKLKSIPLPIFFR